MQLRNKPKIPTPNPTISLIKRYGGVLHNRVKPKKKKKVKIFSLIRVCPGGAHAIYDTNVGAVRKPIQ